MNKSILCLLLCATLLCGCHKITYISREDQLSHLNENTTVPAQDNTTLHTAESTGEAFRSSDTDSADTSTNGDPDSETSAVPETTDAAKGTTATNDSKATESTKASEGSKTTESTKSTNSTKATESTKTTESTKATATSVPDDTTVPDTTAPESTVPPETTSPVVDDPYDISNHTVGSMEYTVHAAMNEQRTAAGVPELSLDGYLCAIASVRAYEASQYWSHNRLNGSNWSTVLSSYGYGYSTAAENLAQVGIGTGGYTVVSLWAGSEGHLANMVNPNYTHAGVGVYDYNGMTYVACLYVG